jgi:hypothetical protein
MACIIERNGKLVVQYRSAAHCQKTAGGEAIRSTPGMSPGHRLGAITPPSKPAINGGHRDVTE